jgi:hypothetical protein
MLMGSRRLSVTVFVICTSLCLCSVLTYLLHPLPHFLSFPHFFLGACCWCCMSNSSPWDWEQNMQDVLPPACNSVSTRYAQILFRKTLVLNCGDMLWYFVWCSVATALYVLYKHCSLTCCCYQNLMLTTMGICCCSIYKVKILYGITPVSFTLVGLVGAICNVRFEVHSVVLLNIHFSCNVVLCHWVCSPS